MSDFEKKLVEFEKSDKFDSLISYARMLSREERMFLMLKLDAMNEGPKEITVSTPYKSPMW